MLDASFRKFIIPMLAVISIGISGYMLIEGWSFIDAFYMTITTLTTVGFGEVHPLSSLGKIFTSTLILTGVGTAAYSLSKIVSYIIEGEIYKTRRIKTMKKTIEELRNHVIICGYGRLGKVVCKDLIDSNEDVVVIDYDETLHNDSLLLLDRKILFVKGSAYEDEVLKIAGIEKAKVLISLLPNDADNVYVALCARDLNPHIKIVARTEDEGGESRLKRAGADEVIAPYRLSGHNIVQKILRPNVSNFLELTRLGSSNNLIIEEIKIPENCALCNVSIEESHIRTKTGIIIAAIVSPEGEMVFNPTGKDIIHRGSTLIILGDRDSIDKMQNLLSHPSDK